MTGTQNSSLKNIQASETIHLENAFLPKMIVRNGNRILDNILAITCGVALISLMAQITIHLPFTPVPITGQTFGVALTSLLWGRKRGLATMISYLSLGGLGLPIFALGSSGLSVGPTSGYLIGMVFASYLMGTLSDLGWTQSFFKSWLATFLGSVVIFSFGLLALSYFVPAPGLFIAGLWPFLPGDAIKTLLASFIAYKVSMRVNRPLRLKSQF
jgi:biotin transport system substrate-specific component